MCDHGSARHHGCAPRVTAFPALALLLLVSIAASGDSTVPANVAETNLGAPDSELSIQLVDVPYFPGERMVFKATVRNTQPDSRRLPEPQALFANVGKVPPGMRVEGCVWHSDGARSFLDNVNTDMQRCITNFKSRFQVYKPGESRSALFTSDSLGCRDSRLEMDGNRPTDFGFVVSSHDILPDRSWRVTIHLFTDPIYGRLVEDPTDHSRTFVFVKEGLPGQFHLLSTGSWHPNNSAVPREFSAANVNEWAEVFGVITYGLSPTPEPPLGCDSVGRILVNGHVAEPPRIPEQDTLSHGLVRSPSVY